MDFEPLVLPTNSFVYVAHGQPVSAAVTGCATEHVIRFPPGSCVIGHHLFTPEEIEMGALRGLGLVFQPLSRRRQVTVLVVEWGPE